MDKRKPTNAYSIIHPLGNAPEPEGKMHNPDPKRFQEQADGTIIDTGMHPKVLRAQKEDAYRRSGAKGPKKIGIAIAIRAEKAALNEAAGVTHGQVR